jgi:receptor protein-tyrosine kinase
VEVQVRPTGVVRDAATAYQGNLLASGLVKSYAHLMTGDVVVSGVLKTLGLSGSVKSVQSRIQASPITDTSLISVTASDRSAATAARIAQSVVEQFHSYLVKLAAPASVPVADVTVVEPPSVPTSASDPRPARNLGIGAVLGLLVGAALANWRDRGRPATLALRDPHPTALSRDTMPTMDAEPNSASHPGRRPTRRRV